MQLERGPLAELAPVVLLPPDGDTTFLQLAVDAERENGANDAEIGLLIDGAYQQLGFDPRGDTEPELWEAEAGADTSGLGDLPDGFDDMDSARAESSDYIVTAISKVPGESYVPVPDPIEQPADPPTFQEPPTPDDAPQVHN